MKSILPGIIALVMVGSAACGGNELGVAQLANLQDTVTLGALTGTPVEMPSGFSITSGVAVRTDGATGFDFVYDVLPDRRKVLMPLAAIGMEIPNGTNPGLFRYNGTFESIVSAPSSGYAIRDTLEIATGNVILGRSRVICYLGVPQYAKLKVLSFNEQARTVTFEVIAGVNCGYRNLQPGVPEN